MNPQFSIIIPLFNKEKTIISTLESVIVQPYNDWEIIIVDDGSTDNSIEQVQKLSDYRIQIVRKENGGPSSARNCGVNAAHYTWIIFLDADDTMEPNALPNFAKEIQSNPNYDMYVGNYYLVSGEDMEERPNNRIRRKIKKTFKSWFMGTFMPCAGTYAVKKELLKEFPFNESLRRYEDADMLVKLLRKTAVFQFPKPVMSYNRDFSCASKKRNDINEDYLGHIDLRSGSFWERVLKYSYYIEAKNCYPTETRHLYKYIENRYHWKLIYRVLLGYRKFCNKYNI